MGRALGSMQFCTEGAVTPPVCSCRGQPDSSQTHRSDSSQCSLCLERTKKAYGSSCPAQRQLCCILLKPRTAPVLLRTARGLTPCSTAHRHGAHVAHCHRSRDAMENATLHIGIVPKAATHPTSKPAASHPFFVFFKMEVI